MSYRQVLENNFSLVLEFVLEYTRIIWTQQRRSFWRALGPVYNWIRFACRTLIVQMKLLNLSANKYVKQIKGTNSVLCHINIPILPVPYKINVSGPLYLLSEGNLTRSSRSHNAFMLNMTRACRFFFLLNHVYLLRGPPLEVVNKRFCIHVQLMHI